MKLWTVQPIEFYDRLIREGELYCIEEFVDDGFKHSYDWLIWEMENRIGKPPHIKSYPIWAWFQYESDKRRRPDLRNSGFLRKGDKGVRIEFVKPENEVLLSDFDLWHFVLNYWYIPDNEQESEEFDRLLESNNIAFIDKEKYTPEIKDKVEKSWSKIFDMDYCPEDTAKPFEKKAIQATCWSLKESEITNVDFFIAR